MILAHQSCAGQLNVPDIFTRLLLSLLATGLAPRSFYRASDGARPHYDGLPVDYVASAIAGLGAATTSGFHTYNAVNPHDDGVSLDSFVDWLIDAGYPIERIEDFDLWVSRFETAMRALPDEQRRNSVLMVMDAFREPIDAVPGSLVPSDRFQQATNDVLGQKIPHITATLIEKYAADLSALKLL